MCLTAKALAVFLGLLDPEIIEIVDDKNVIVHANTQSVTYSYVEWIDLFCIDGIYISRTGELF